MYREATAPVPSFEALDWNLFDFAYQVNPYRHYRWLRDNSPVHRFTLPNGHVTWLVSGHEDVRRILMDHDTWSSETAQDLPWLVFTDPPKHTRMRGAIQRAMTDKAIAALDPEVLRLTREMFAPLLAASGGDAVRFAALLPVGVIALVLGIPTDRAAQLGTWSLQSLEVLGQVFGRPVSPEAYAGSAALMDYLREVLARYATAPSPSIGSDLVQLQLAGELTEQEVLRFAQFLFVAGHETTSHSLSGGIGILAQDPALFARLKADRALVPAFVEEVLRYRPALQATSRVARRPTTLAGEEVPAGTFVRVMLGNANMDPSKFTDPERFDLDRDRQALLQHVSFGKGIHTCIGAPLARREMRIAYEHILDTVDALSLDPDREPVPHVGGSTNEYGFDALHVRIS